MYPPPDCAGAGFARSTHPTTRQRDYLHTEGFGEPYIRAVIVPEMQIKLKQGFGRAIRTETDTCVVAILDERACPGQRYYQDAKVALPDMLATSHIRDVEEFIRKAKPESYFQEGLQ